VECEVNVFSLCENLLIGFGDDVPQGLCPSGTMSTKHDKSTLHTPNSTLSLFSVFFPQVAVHKIRFSELPFKRAVLTVSLRA